MAVIVRRKRVSRRGVPHVRERKEIPKKVKKGVARRGIEKFQQR